MTKAKKASAPVVDLENKKRIIGVIERAEAKLAKLRADIELDDNPDVTLFIATCNEKTSQVTGVIEGSTSGLSTTIASLIEEDASIKRFISKALILSL